MFKGISWSTEVVFNQTSKQAEILGLKVETLIELIDIDNIEDLEKSLYTSRIEELKLQLSEADSSVDRKALELELSDLEKKQRADILDKKITDQDFKPSKEKDTHEKVTAEKLIK